MELVENEAVALELLEYNHFVLKGDLDGKREILVNLGRYLEPLLVSRKLQKAGYKQIESDMSFLLNCFHTALKWIRYSESSRVIGATQPASAPICSICCK